MAIGGGTPFRRRRGDAGLLKRGSSIVEGPRDVMSVEILSTAEQMYEKSEFKRPSLYA